MIIRDAVEGVGGRRARTHAHFVKGEIMIYREKMDREATEREEHAIL